MDRKDIEKLLERYFEGETSLAEEKQLRRYFVEGPVADEHLPYRDLFRFFSRAQDEGLTAEIVHPAGETPAPEAKIRRLRPRALFWRAAAIVAIALGGWWLYPETEPQPTAIDWSQYEPASAEEAFRLTSGALKEASAKLNRGARQAAQEVAKVRKVF